MRAPNRTVRIWHARSGGQWLLLPAVVASLAMLCLAGLIAEPALLAVR